MRHWWAVNSVRKAAWAVVAVGAGMRLGALTLGWERSPATDTEGYLEFARSFSYGRPLGPVDREPLWLAIVKTVAGPFGYSSRPLRVFTVILSVGVLLAVLWIARQLLGLRGELVAVTVVAIHLFLAEQAARGLREELVSLLLLSVFAATCVPKLRAPPLWVAPLAAALLMIRWELGLVALLVVAMGCVLGRRWQPIALATAMCLSLAVPWLVANGDQFGDPLYHSNRHAKFFRDLESPSEDRITWAEYYLEFVGPERTVRRLVTGTPEVAAKLLWHSAAVPDVPDVLPLSSWPAGLLLPLKGVGFLVLIVEGLLVVAGSLTRDRRFLIAAGVCAACFLGYGALPDVDGRLLTPMLPLIALLAGRGAEAVSTRRVIDSSAPATRPRASRR